MSTSANVVVISRMTVIVIVIAIVIAITIVITIAIAHLYYSLFVPDTGISTFPATPYPCPKRVLTLTDL
jgi:hypothetical protein